LLGWQEGGIAIFMTLIGGAGYFVGPFLGSIVYTFLHAYVTGFTVYWPLTIGMVILLIVIFSPGGLMGIIDAKISPGRGSLIRKKEPSENLKRLKTEEEAGD
jgi:branched-chain amino acid transport system permease protein